MVKKKSVKPTPSKVASKSSLKDYAKTLSDLKRKIQEAQIKSVLAAN